MRFAKFLTLLPTIVAYITFSFFFDDNNDNFPSINDPRLEHTPVTINYTTGNDSSVIITPTSSNGLVHILNPDEPTHFIIEIPGCLKETFETDTTANVLVVYVKVFRTCPQISLPLVRK